MKRRVQSKSAMRRLAANPGGSDNSRLRASGPRRGERAIYWALAGCAGLSIVTTTAIVISLLIPSLQFFGEVPLGDFLFGTDWSPTINPHSFGVLAIVAGTFSVTLWALLFAVPVGLGVAIYLSEYASRRRRRLLKPLVELLAGVPTVAFGFFALSFLTPLIQGIWPGFLGDEPGVFSVASAGLAIGLMIVPMIASVSEDAMRAVPNALREGAYALGATRARVATRVVFPAALSGIVAAIILAISRTVGETMIVLIAAGNTPNENIFKSFNPVESIQAMTGFIGSIATGDLATGSLEYKTVFAVALLLFVMTLAMNAVSIRLVNRYREVYE